MISFLRRLFGKRASGAAARRGVAGDAEEDDPRGLGITIEQSHDHLRGRAVFTLKIDDAVVFRADPNLMSELRDAKFLGVGERLKMLARAVGDVELESLYNSGAVRGVRATVVEDLKLIAISAVDNSPDPACRIDGRSGFAVEATITDVESVCGGAMLPEDYGRSIPVDSSNWEREIEEDVARWAKDIGLKPRKDPTS